ncbi:unnamed protein product [Caenorhabditis sp. 36 PRJEB53466]|nr:unnamed protein product [Caenorhabditis sp. 36 PRJEB53466]
MARQPQPEDGSSSRQVSAPINIEYGNDQPYRHYWREEQYRWQQRIEDDEDLDDIQSEDETEDNEEEMSEDQLLMMHNGFSGAVVEPPAEKERRVGDVTQDAITLEEKIAEMDDDIFEQLLAENERKLRQLISYVENVHLVLN